MAEFMWLFLHENVYHQDVESMESDAVRVDGFLEVFEREINYEILGRRLGLNSYSGEKSSQSTVNISRSHRICFSVQVFMSMHGSPKPERGSHWEC